MNPIIIGIIDWIKDDWKSNSFRFCVELFVWLLSITCSLVVAITVPTPPFLILYPIWITGCALYTWVAYSRKSFGMLANYLLLTSIDLLGFVRLLNA
jgi:hypothetical protein